MESKALKTYPLPQAKTVHCTDNGLRIWHPAFTQLQVCHVVAGDVVLTVTDPDGRRTLFAMSPAQRDHLVNLLLSSPQPSTETAHAG